MGDHAERDNQKVVEANKLFSGECHFVLGVANLPQLPETAQPEYAFVGRSNVGKSSLLNAVLNRKNLVKTSKTPGRTQELNFFNLADTLMLVDLPGYGYAKASKSKIAQWNSLMTSYLRGRTQLRRVYVLIDSRHGIKSSDTEMMKMLDECAVSYQVILTKRDKINTDQADMVLSKTIQAIKKHGAAHPDVLMTSSEKSIGLEDVRVSMLSVA